MRLRYAVDAYRRGASGVSAYREQRAEWRPHLSDVSIEIQLARGDVEQTPAGQEAEARIDAWADPGTDLEPGDGVQVTAGPGLIGERFAVKAAYDWGPPGYLELRLEQTLEVFD